MKSKGLRWKVEGPKWLEEYRKWEASGQSQVRYCQANDISYGTLKIRIKQLREKGLLGASDLGPQKSKFVPVQLKTESKAAEPRPYCEMRFSQAGRIIIESRESLEGLRELVGIFQG